MTDELRIRHELYVSGGYSFTPDEARFRNPLASRAEDWAVEWDEGQERMFMGREWYNLEHHQTAILHRDGRLLVLSAARLPVVVPSFDDVRASLATARPADLHIEVVPARIEESGVIRVSTSLEPGEWLVGIELMGKGWLGRARYGLPAPRMESGFGISDPVLVDDRFETAQLPLNEALLPSTDVSGRSQVGVYFEAYGVRQEEPVRISLSIERTDRSLFRRIASALRLSSNAAVSVNWLEAAESGEMMPRYLAVDLRRLESGSHRIEITVERETGERASSSRDVIRR